MLCKVSVRLLHHLCILRAQKLAVAVVSLIRIVREGKREPDLFIVKRYRKNSENMPRGLYFSKALFEGLIFGGAYIRRDLSAEGNLCFKIDWATLIFGRLLLKTLLKPSANEPDLNR